MRYVIWHTPRTGSNVLCDCIVKSGLGGMVDLYTAGFFIGFGEGVKEAYANGAVEEYFTKNRTPNGIEGCKLGWDYVEHLHHVLPFGAVDSILLSFDKHIILSRRDEVAQAVSRLIARQTAKWTSLDNPQDTNLLLPVEYNRDRLTYFIAQHAGHQTSIERWLALNSKSYLLMDYETNCIDWRQTVEYVLRYAGVEDEVPPIEPTLQKQTDGRKREWVERYRRGE